MIKALADKRIQQILSVSGEDEWKQDLKRLEQGDVMLTRKSAGEASIKAIQRLLIFLGYSTSANGAFAIDGDFGRGTNRGVAQYQFENRLTRKIRRDTLCYDCTWQNASARITTIPDTAVTVKTLANMADTAIQMIGRNEVMCGDYKVALGYLNGVHNSNYLSCKRLLKQYGKLVAQAVEQIEEESQITINAEWILAIIKQETAGVVRPRFEQHILTRLNRKAPTTNFTELRFRSMSLGLGQIMGLNYKRAGASSAKGLYTSPLKNQVLYVGRFLVPKAEILSKSNPTDSDFRKIARFYNGPGYAKHHYHERIARWYREFRNLL